MLWWLHLPALCRWVFGRGKWIITLLEKTFKFSYRCFRNPVEIQTWRSWYSCKPKCKTGRVSKNDARRDFWTMKLPVSPGRCSLNTASYMEPAIKGFTPLKTNMTMEKHHLKMYFLLKMVIFQCHVSFPGCRHWLDCDTLAAWGVRIASWHIDMWCDCWTPLNMRLGWEKFGGKFLAIFHQLADRKSFQCFFLGGWGKG